MRRGHWPGLARLQEAWLRGQGSEVWRPLRAVGAFSAACELGAVFAESFWLLLGSSLSRVVLAFAWEQNVADV